MSLSLAPKSYHFKTRPQFRIFLLGKNPQTRKNPVESYSLWLACVPTGNCVVQLSMRTVKRKSFFSCSSGQRALVAFT